MKVLSDQFLVSNPFRSTTKSERLEGFFSDRNNFSKHVLETSFVPSLHQKEASTSIKNLTYAINNVCIIMHCVTTYYGLASHLYQLYGHKLYCILFNSLVSNFCYNGIIGITL